MLKKFPFVILLLCLLFSTQAYCAPVGASTNVEQTSSAQAEIPIDYRPDLTQKIIQEALPYFRSFLKPTSTASEKIIVIDIHETALTDDPNHPNDRRYQQIIPQIKALFDFLITTKFQVYFISASATSAHKFLSDQLEEHGYMGYQRLITMPDQIYDEIIETAIQLRAQKIAAWKEQERIKLVQATQYKIIATIDDLPENLTGERVGLPILVPASLPLPKNTRYED